MVRKRVIKFLQMHWIERVLKVTYFSKENENPISIMRSFNDKYRSSAVDGHIKIDSDNFLFKMAIR